MTTIYPAIGSVIGAVVAVLLIFILFFILAPYRQRNEARAKITELENTVSKITPVPVIEISVLPSEPNQSAKVMIDGQTRNLEHLTLLRVEVANAQPSTQVDGLTVRLESSEPRIEFLAVVLHKKHDNKYPYPTEHTLKHKQPEPFDVIAMDETSERLYVYRVGEEHYVYPVQNKECYEALRGSGLRLTISAYANQPAKGTERTFVARIQEDGKFIVESLE